MIANAHRTSRTRGRAQRAGLIGIAAASLVAGSVLTGVVSGPASATATTPNPFAKMVVLQTGSTSQVAYYPASTAADPVIQPLKNAKGCYLDVTSTPVMTLVGSTPGSTDKFVGLDAGSLGVPEKGTNKGQACSQVNVLTGGSETLTLKLQKQGGVDISALFAVLDIEVLKNVVVEATTTLLGGSSQTFKLYTGQAIVPSPLPANSTVCKLGATSSSPNSGPTDNCKWTISGAKRFDTIVLKATSAGQFSLQGGAQWPGGPTAQSGGVPTNATYFYLGEACPTTQDVVRIAGASGADLDASYTRTSTNIDGSICLNVTKTLTRDADGDLVLINEGGQNYMQGIVIAPWEADPETDATNTTEVNFVPGKPVDGWETMPWCPTALLNSSGAYQPLTGISSDADTAAGQLTGLGLVDQDHKVFGAADDNKHFQYACVISRATSYKPLLGTYETIDQIYLLGDVAMRK